MEEWSKSTKGWLKFRRRSILMDPLAEKESEIQSVLTSWFHSEAVAQSEGESD